MSEWNSRTYGYFRMILGLYLLLHFIGLAPWAAELFASGGLVQAASSPLTGLFPNPLVIWDTPAAASAMVTMGAGLSALLIVGKHDRIVAVLLWFIWACLFARNPLIANPGIPFVGWLLLFHAALPVDDRDPNWRLPRSFFTLAWTVMALGYSFSGVTKLVSPSWVDGTALFHVLESPLARPTILREWLVSHPDLLRVMSYGVLGLETLAAPLATFRRFRPWLWTAFVAMHVGILVTVDFADLTWGMLMVHVITFNPEWLPGRLRTWSNALLRRRGATVSVGKQSRSVVG